MDRQIVAVKDPYTLQGTDGGLYYPVYSNDTSLLAGERINCHCISQPIVDEKILGLSWGEREKLLHRSLDQMDDEWMKEQDEKNRAKAGIEVYPHCMDVSDEYARTASPGKGIIRQEKGYKPSKHKREIAMAEYLYKTYGGDIKLCTESEAVGVKTPDFIWHNRKWELKNVTTEKAIDSAVRHAIKQIRDKPGGIILDFQENSVSAENVLASAVGRLKRSGIKEVDILLLAKDWTTVHAYRYTK